MLTPEYLYRISEASEEISGELHEYIVRRIIEGIMNRIGRGESYLLTARDRWMLETLQEAGYVLEDIMQEIKKKTRLQEKELKEAMEEAGIKALEYDDLVYAMADIPPTNLRASPHLIRLMQRNYEATLGTMKNFTKTTATAAQRLFLQEVDNAYTLVSTGTVSYTKAVKDAVEKIAEQGVTVVYPSGRKDTIEAATLRAVRTGIAQSTAEISLARMEETDWDIILTSAHIGARTGDGGENPGNHYWWQGRFFSRTGRTKEFPDFKTCTGYGTVEGLDGANCRHSFGPGDGIHNPFQEFDKEENRKVEKLNQRQRLLERRIRKTKRELQGMKAGIDACKDEKLKFELQQDYDKKAHLLQKQNDAYSKYCDENGLKKLQDRLRIAKWDRKQAAEARAAAKRHQTARGTNTLKNAAGQDIIKVEKNSLTAEPNSITQVTKKKGGIERNYYDENGRQYKQISNNNHGNPKQHPYGKNGEHTHDYVYDEEGKLIDRPVRELTENERKENADVL